MGVNPARVGLLFGGRSVEHEVSVVSARGIARGLREGGLEAVPIAVSPDGRWLSPELSATILGDGRAVAEPSGGEDDRVRIAVDPGGGGLVRIRTGGPAEPLALDAVFPIIHGWGGEDGRLQGLLELSGLPYVGAGVCGSAVAMDKEMARAVLERRGVPMVPWRAVRAEEFDDDPGRLCGDLAAELGFPMFVKPANGGSSVGIRRVREASTLADAVRHALEHDRKAVVERGVDAREIECAVLGNERPEASIPGEIVPGAEFYTYEDKYLDGAAELRVPAALEPEIAERVRSLAIVAYRGLDLAGMARVDFFVERDGGRVLFNEANTLPGFTPISMYSKLWEATGVPYGELVRRLVELAVRRHAAARRLRTRRTDA